MKTLQVAVLVVVLILSAAVAGFAQKSCPCAKEIKIWGGLASKPKTAEAYTPQKVSIGVGSFEMLELRQGAAGYSLSEREVAVYNRLIEALSRGPVNSQCICVARVRSAPTIYVGGLRLVSVYASDAAAAGMTQDELAARWRDRIAAVLPKVATAPVAPRPLAAGGYDVAVGGQFLFRLRDHDGYPSVKARGIAVEEQVVKMLSDGRKGRLTAVAAQAGDEWVVKYGELCVVTVTGADAAANGLTPQAQAERWTADLNRALAKLAGSTAAAAGG